MTKKSDVKRVPKKGGIRFSGRWVQNGAVIKPVFGSQFLTWQENVLYISALSYQAPTIFQQIKVYQ